LLKDAPTLSAAWRERFRTAALLDVRGHVALGEVACELRDVAGAHQDRGGR